MIDELEEDNDLALLEPVLERAGSISTSFAYSTFGGRLDGATFGICTERDEKELSVPR